MTGKQLAKKAAFGPIRPSLKRTINVRQMGGMAEVSAAFQNKQIAGAVTSSLRVDGIVQPRLLMKLEDLGFQYSMDVIAYSKDGMKRAPQEKAYQTIAKYAGLRDQKKIDEIYQDSILYLEKTPRVEPEAINSILNFMGKKGVAVETFADNTLVDKMVREGFIDKLYKKP
jgi:hypothetical protein